jgi:hypothetical protein
VGRHEKLGVHQARQTANGRAQGGAVRSGRAGIPVSSSAAVGASVRQARRWIWVKITLSCGATQREKRLWQVGRAAHSWGGTDRVNRSGPWEKENIFLNSYSFSSQLRNIINLGKILRSVRKI